MNNAAIDIKNYLDTQISGNVTLSGYTIYVSQEPSTPDNVITIYNTGGLDISCLNSSFSENSNIQIRVRNNSYEDCRDAQEAIRVIIQPVKFNSTEISSIINYVYRNGSCIDLRRDESNRSITVQNYGIVRSET